MTFKGTTKDVKTIAARAGRAVRPRRQRAPGRRAGCGSPLSSSTRAPTIICGPTRYDGTIEDVFAIQERLARVIVEALELRLTADEERRLAERPIDNLHAYECYLRARQEGWRWRKDAIDHAIQLLRNGLEIIGDNARLYAALGLAYLQYREAGIDFGERPLARGRGLRAEGLRARAGIRVGIAAARVDPLLARAHPGRGARPESGARHRSQQRRHAAAAEQLLPDLRPGVGRAPAHRPPAGGRSR